MERKKEFKFYEAPEMEVVDVELEGAILEGSVDTEYFPTYPAEEG